MNFSKFDCGYFFTLAFVFGCVKADYYKIDENLKNISPTTLTTVIVTFSADPLPTIQSFSSRSFANRGQKISQMVTSLEKLAEASQHNVTEFLTINKIEYQTIWLTNQLVVKDMPAILLEELSKFADVGKIVPNTEIPLDEPINLQVNQVRRNETGIIEWGIRTVRAVEAHYLMNITATPLADVVVATIDTGVLWTHEALRNNFLGEYGWFDPYGLSPLPIDLNGHGSHVTGTIQGERGIGVYPAAKWMACRGCDTGTCSIAALLLCGQFITCPTLPDMSQRDCTKAPHIVSNSWGGGQNEDWYDVVIEAWHAAMIIPVFSGGNNGPDCSTANSPGDRNVISVGSTNNDDSISYFSSRGPGMGFDSLKPEVSAPGSLILSSYNLGDASYATASGTSMACPHVSGIIAMMKAINPSLSYDQVKSYLQNGVDTDTLLAGDTGCADIPAGQFPNYAYGYGRVNALKTISQLMLSTNTEGTQAPPQSTSEGTQAPPQSTSEGSSETSLPTTTPSHSSMFICNPVYLLVAFLIIQTASLKF